MGADVLVLDPDPSTVQFLADRLALEGYRVDGVGSLDAGVRAARAARPWIVVTHADSPDGLLFANEIKSDPALRDVLVVVVSDGVPGAHITSHLLSGGPRADLYVRRPLGNAFFGARLERWLLVQSETVGSAGSDVGLTSLSGSQPLAEEPSLGELEADPTADLAEREVELTERELALDLKESALVQRESTVGVQLSALRKEAEDAAHEAALVRMEVEAQRADLSIAQARAAELAEIEARAKGADAHVDELRRQLAEAAEAAQKAQREADAARAEAAASKTQGDSIRLALEEGQAAVLAARGDLDAAIAERDSAKAEFAQLADDKDSALKARDAAVAERDAAVAERDAAVAERDAADEGRDAAVADLDALGAARDAAVAERDTALAERDTALAERDAANEGWRGAVADLDALGAERDEAVAARDAAAAAQAAASAARDEIQQRVEIALSTLRRDGGSDS